MASVYVRNCVRRQENRLGWRRANRLERASYSAIEVLERRVLMSYSVDVGTAGLSLPTAITDVVEHGGGTITFASSYSSPITLASGPLVIPSGVNVDINGDSNGNSGITVSGNSASTVFQLNTGSTATFTGLSITDGNTSGNGGGIYNQGTLTIDDCDIYGDDAGNGGGIFNTGYLNISNSTIGCASVNTSVGSDTAGDGGGICNSGTIGDIDHCEILGDSASGNGGGIDNKGIIRSISNNSKIDADIASGDGGGIYNQGNISILGSDISDDTSERPVVIDSGDGHVTYAGGGGIYSSGESYLSVGSGTTLCGDSAAGNG